VLQHDATTQQYHEHMPKTRKRHTMLQVHFLVRLKCIYNSRLWLLRCCCNCKHLRNQRGRRVAGGELRHLAGSPGGGGVIRSCHTLVRVNTV